MILDNVGKYPERVFGVFRRFPLTMAFALIAAILLIWMNSIGWASETVLSKGKHLRHWLQAYPVGAMGVSFAVSLFFETRKNKSRLALVQILFGVLWAGVSAAVVYCYKFLGDYDITYEFALASCYIAIFTAPLVLPFWGQKDDRNLWLFAGDFIKRTLASALASLALCGILCGLLEIILILFNVDFISSTVIVDVLIFSLTFLTPLFALSVLPKTEYAGEEYKPGKVMYAISRIILPAIVAVYLLIMYAYVVKSLVVTPKPGDISTYAFYAIATILVLVILQYPNFKKAFPFATIPLLIAYFIDEIFFIPTCHDQGSNLYFALVCLWYIIALTLILFKPERCIRWMLVSFAVIMLAGSIGPQRMNNAAKFIPEKGKVKEPVQACKNLDETSKSTISFRASSDYVDVPEGYSKMSSVLLFCGQDCPLQVDDSVVTFPVYKGGGDNKVEITRFSVPVQTLKDIAGSYKEGMPYPEFRNDSAVLVTYIFELSKDEFRKDQKYFLEYHGYLFLK